MMLPIATYLPLQLMSLLFELTSKRLLNLARLGEPCIVLNYQRLRTVKRFYSTVRNVQCASMMMRMVASRRVVVRVMGRVRVRVVATMRSYC